MKRIQPAAAALALAALLALPAFASDAGGETAAHHKAVNAAIAAAMKDGVVTDAVCESCGQGPLIWTGAEYTSWVSRGVEGAVPCVHHDPWRRDEVLERTAVKHYVCDRCGQSAQDSAQELQYVHHP